MLVTSHGKFKNSNISTTIAPVTQCNCVWSLVLWPLLAKPVEENHDFLCSSIIFYLVSPSKKIVFLKGLINAAKFLGNSVIWSSEPIRFLSQREAIIVFLQKGVPVRKPCWRTVELSLWLLTTENINQLLAIPWSLRLPAKPFLLTCLVIIKSLCLDLMSHSKGN